MISTPIPNSPRGGDLFYSVRSPLRRIKAWIFSAGDLHFQHLLSLAFFCILCYDNSTQKYIVFSNKKYFYQKLCSSCSKYFYEMQFIIKQVTLYISFILVCLYFWCVRPTWTQHGQKQRQEKSKTQLQNARKCDEKKG